MAVLSCKGDLLRPRGGSWRALAIRAAACATLAAFATCICVSAPTALPFSLIEPLSLSFSQSVASRIAGAFAGGGGGGGGNGGAC